MVWSQMTGAERAAAIIAGLSALASWINTGPTIYGWFKGFDPAITIGRIAIGRAPTKTTEDKIAIFMKVNIKNESEDAGCVTDFNLKLQDMSGEQPKRHFAPVFFVDIKDYVELSKVGVDTSSSISGLFSKVVLTESSFAEREIAFMHKPFSDQESDIMTIQSLKASLYQVELSVSSGSLPCVEIGDYDSVLDEPLHFRLTDRLIRDVTNGSLVYPVDAELEQRRQDMMRQ